MSLNALAVSEQVAGGGKVSDSNTLISQIVNYGSGVLPSGNITFGFGTGAGTVGTNGASGNANAWYAAQRTVAATTADNLTLYGSLTDAEGATLNFKYIRRILIYIISPDGIKSLYVGPRGISSAWGGAANMPWPGGATSVVYEQVWWKWDIVHPFAGWTVDHTTPADVLGIYNPGATSVTYAIWIIGEQ